ncbi:MAG TPA: 3-oxoacyl-ACP reductase [Thermoleophilaceae bacterium]|nr:3-oxoacyl-ACP reductase [Thermoleophilaceae bacterium]
MADRYQELTLNPIGRTIAKRVGLPTPPKLRRYEPDQPLVDGPVLLGAAPGARVEPQVADMLHAAGVDVRTWAEEGDERFGALVFDATGIDSSDALKRLHGFFQPVARSVAPSGRVVVIGAPPEDLDRPRAATAQRALEGFLRSLAKEIAGGATAQLVYVAEGAEGALESTLRFLLSARSAYVSGQMIRVRPPGDGDEGVPHDWTRPLDGKVAVVTGASRGIGEAITRVLARDGAHVVALDVPAQGEALSGVVNRFGGEAVQLDITAAQAPEELAEHLRDRHGGVDVVVHNAGITRDKTLARMDERQWGSVIAVNLTSQERINDALLARDDGLRPSGRIVSVSSVSGIAGNRGQTNYAASKAGIIGMVQALAPALAERASTINAVAPGFIETEMTGAMPLLTREGGRRINSMSQGGLPVDVAETIAWFASPGSGGVNGQVVRVDGQSMLGA